MSRFQFNVDHFLENFRDTNRDESKAPSQLGHLTATTASPAALPAPDANNLCTHFPSNAYPSLHEKADTHDANITTTHNHHPALATTAKEHQQPRTRYSTDTVEEKSESTLHDYARSMRAMVGTEGESCDELELDFLTQWSRACAQASGSALHVQSDNNTDGNIISGSADISVKRIQIQQQEQRECDIAPKSGNVGGEHAWLARPPIRPTTPSRSCIDVTKDRVGVPCCTLDSTAWTTNTANAEGTRHTRCVTCNSNNNLHDATGNNRNTHCTEGKGSQGAYKSPSSPRLSATVSAAPSYSIGSATTAQRSVCAQLPQGSPTNGRSAMNTKVSEAEAAALPISEMGQRTELLVQESIVPGKKDVTLPSRQHRSPMSLIAHGPSSTAAGDVIATNPDNDTTNATSTRLTRANSMIHGTQRCVSEFVSADATRVHADAIHTDTVPYNVITPAALSSESRNYAESGKRCTAIALKRSRGSADGCGDRVDESDTTDVLSTCVAKEKRHEDDDGDHEAEADVAEREGEVADAMTTTPQELTAAEVTVCHNAVSALTSSFATAKGAASAAAPASCLSSHKLPAIHTDTVIAKEDEQRLLARASELVRSLGITIGAVSTISSAGAPVDTPAEAVPSSLLSPSVSQAAATATDVEEHAGTTALSTHPRSSSNPNHRSDVSFATQSNQLLRHVGQAREEAAILAAEIQSRVLTTMKLFGPHAELASLLGDQFAATPVATLLPLLIPLVQNLLQKGTVGEKA